jgi:MSHA biogenesis protein MshJ
VKLPPALESLIARFDRFSLRERGLVAGALLVAIVMTWDATLMQPLRKKEQSLTAELKTMHDGMAALNATFGADAGSDPTSQAMAQEQSVQAALAAVNAELASASAGLIPPDRMTEVLHDVLSHQRGVRLVSLRNKPVVTLEQAAAPKQVDEKDPAAPQQPAAPAKPETGPYVHSVELTVEGQYLDVLAYLQSLEDLSWRIYWKALDLQTVEHPVNRVLIELSTLSMDKEWLGVGTRTPE